MRGNGLVKAILGLAVLAVMAAVLVVSLRDAKRRATLTHCRNNLRKLGELAIKYPDLDGPRWDSLCRDYEATFGRPCDFASDGRGLWQRIKILGFARKKRETPDSDRVSMSFNLEPMNMFDCPVNGPNAAPVESIESIDYRGPTRSKLLVPVVPSPFPIRRRFQYDVEPFASDRPGNHADGRVYVLYMDLTVSDGVEQWWVGKRVQDPERGVEHLIPDAAPGTEDAKRADEFTKE